MAVIQTVPGSETVSTPPAGVKLNYDALNAPNRAKQDLAGAFSYASAKVDEFGQQIQAVKNFGIAADADRTMRQATADFQASRAGRTDEDQWGQEWKDKAAAVQDQILSNQGAGPDLRRTLSNNLKNWNQSNAIEVQTIARKQMINRSVERASLAADEAAKSGDEQGVLNALTPLVKIGAAYPEKVQAMVKNYTDKIDQYKADNFIENNPVKAVDWLREKDADGEYANVTRINPDQRRIMIRNAEIQKSRVQADNYDSAKLDIDNGNVYTPEAINGLENDGTIAAKQAQGLRNYIKVKGSQPKIENQPQYAAAVATSINNIPAGLDADTRRHYITDIVTSKEYLGLLEPVRKVFDDQMKQDAISLKPVESELFKQAAEDHRNGMFLPRGTKDVDVPGTGFLGFFGDKKKTMTETPDVGEDNTDEAHWEKTAPRAIIDAEQMHYAKYLTNMRQFFKEKPNATDEEAQQYSQKLKQPYVMSAVTQALSRPKVTVPAAAIDHLKKNPALAKEFDAKYGEGSSKFYLAP